jgi:hypothetical protein
MGRSFSSSTRGEWCPYCNILLRSYGLRAGDFSERGARRGERMALRCASDLAQA